MIKQFKHKIALLLCLVFVTRILFVQIGIFYVANAPGKGVSKATITATDTRQTHFEAEGLLKSGNYSVMEFLEDLDSTGSKFKLFIIPVLLMLLAIPLARLLSHSHSALFHRVLSYASLQRFLALRTIRI